MPCETDRGCPYDPSPGDAELAPENVLAMHVWERLQLLGAAAWEVIHVELSPADADLLGEQLAMIAVHQAQMARERANQG